MPMCKWMIHPVDLTTRFSEDGSTTNTNSCKTHPPDNYDELANLICSNVIRQLADLANQAEDIFKELESQSFHVTSRFVKLKGRVDDLKDRAQHLNPTVEQISLDDVMQCKPFKSGLNQYISDSGGRPDAIQKVLSQIDPIPDFDSWNCYKTDDKDRSKLYSDPNFFFESWCGQIKQEVDKLKPARKKKVTKKKAEITRKPQNVNLNKIQNRMKNEILGGRPTAANQTSGSQSPHSSHLSIYSGNNPDSEKQSLTSKMSDANQSLLSESLSNQTAGNGSVGGAKIQKSTAETGIGPLGVEFPLFFGGTNDEAGDHLDDLPDLPLPPPLPVTMEFEPQFPPVPPQSSFPPPPLSPPKQYPTPNRQSVYIVGNFSANSSLLPPPPQLPYLDEAGPPLPPPLPPPTFTAPGGGGSSGGGDGGGDNHFRVRSNASSGAVKSQPSVESSNKRESRGDLLTSIRNGIKLRKVDEVKQEVKNKNNAGQTMFDVQMIMEMRRRALEEEDDDDGDYDDDADGDNDWAD